MNEETIRGEASAALDDLELDIQVTSVSKSGKNWCVHFSDEYGQFCDEFRNQFEKDNSLRVVREKIKKHLLAQVTLRRNKGRRRVVTTGADERDAITGAAELVQDAITQTTRVIGEVIDSTLGATGAGVRSAGEVVQSVADGTRKLLQPESGERASKRVRSQAPREKPVAATHTAKKRTGGTKKRGASKKSGASKSTSATGRTRKSGGKKSSKKR